MISYNNKKGVFYHAKKEKKQKPFFDKPQKNPLLEEIRLYFYNTIVDLALNKDDISTQNITEHIPGLIKQTIISILAYPRSEPQIIFLPTGTAIHHGNCPELYLPLLKGLLQIKPLYQSKLSGEVSKHLDEIITGAALRVACLILKVC